MESIPLKDLSSLVENIHFKTREASQNTDLDMREFLGIDKALQNTDLDMREFLGIDKALQNTDLDMREFLGIYKALQNIKGELLNNASKLTKIDKSIKRDAKKLKEVENDPTYTDEQRQLYRDRLDDLDTEKKARLETLSQNRKDLQTQVVRIKQNIAKVLDQNTSLAERIRTLFREQGITIFSILTALSVTISTIVHAITGVFGVSGGTGGSPPKDEGWFDRLANALKRLGKGR